MPPRTVPPWLSLEKTNELICVFRRHWEEGVCLPDRTNVTLHVHAPSARHQRQIPCRCDAEHPSLGWQILFEDCSGRVGRCLQLVRSGGIRGRTRNLQALPVVPRPSAHRPGLDRPPFPRSGVADCGFDEGPCLSEQRTNTVIRDPDVRYEKRWPRYMDNVRQHGLRSIFAVPVELHDTASAAMNFYTVEPGEFVEDDAVSAQRYADVASTVLGIAVPIPSLAETAGQRWNRGPQSTWLRASS